MSIASPMRLLPVFLMLHDFQVIVKTRGGAGRPDDQIVRRWEWGVYG